MFNESKGITIKMRTKEQAQDYRFISDPDLPLIKIEKQKIQNIKSSLPEPPQEKLKKLIKKHKIEKKHAEVLTKKLEIAEFFEKVIDKINPKIAVPWITVELQRVLNYAKKELNEVEINVEHFIELLKLIQSKAITELKGKEILNKFIPKSFSPKKEAKSQSKISSNKDIEKIAKHVLSKNKKAVADYKAGKKESINFLIGQVMKQSNKRADFKTARKVLEKLLKTS